jgi:hypothetical protein
VASLMTSAVGVDPQTPSALRVAGGAVPSAMPPLLSDVPHRLRRSGVAYGTAAHATPRARLVQRLPSGFQSAGVFRSPTIIVAIKPLEVSRDCANGASRARNAVRASRFVGQIRTAFLELSYFLPIASRVRDPIFD